MYSVSATNGDCARSTWPREILALRRRAAAACALSGETSDHLVAAASGSRGPTFTVIGISGSYNLEHVCEWRLAIAPHRRVVPSSFFLEDLRWASSSRCALW